jgi:uncharacterized membrane protein YkoI
MQRPPVPWPLLLLLTLAAPAPADSDHERARQLAGLGDILPLAKILQRAGGYWQGRIIEVELERKQGRYLYELEVLTPQGRVVKYHLDATTAELVDRQDDD